MQVTFWSHDRCSSEAAGREGGLVVAPGCRGSVQGHMVLWLRDSAAPCLGAGACDRGGLSSPDGQGAGIQDGKGQGPNIPTPVDLTSSPQASGPSHSAMAWRSSIHYDDLLNLL